MQPEALLILEAWVDETPAFFIDYVEV